MLRLFLFFICHGVSLLIRLCIVNTGAAGDQAGVDTSKEDSIIVADSLIHY